MTRKTWFITGASRGLGRVWTQAALKRSDKVAATARNPETLADLVDTFRDAILPLTLDVTDRAADFEAVARAHPALRPSRRGRQQRRLRPVRRHRGDQRRGARAEIETNLFGKLWVTQAALPCLREQESDAAPRTYTMPPPAKRWPAGPMPRLATGRSPPR